MTVGLAVRQETFALIRAANDFPQLAEVPPEQDATEFELRFAGGIALDILTTRDPAANGAIARFLSKQGETIQQVEFRCSDVNRAAAILRDHFAQSLHLPRKTPHSANHTQVNFFLASAPDTTKVTHRDSTSNPNARKRGSIPSRSQTFYVNICTLVSPQLSSRTCQCQQGINRLFMRALCWLRLQPGKHSTQKQNEHLCE